jgi:hypothetical protein
MYTARISSIMNIIWLIGSDSTEKISVPLSKPKRSSNNDPIPITTAEI